MKSQDNDESQDERFAQLSKDLKDMKNRLDDKELKIAKEIERKECFMEKLFFYQVNAESEQVSTKEIYNEASRILWENSTFDLTVREEEINEFINPRNAYNITGQPV